SVTQQGEMVRSNMVLRDMASFRIHRAWQGAFRRLRRPCGSIRLPAWTHSVFVCILSYASLDPQSVAQARPEAPSIFCTKYPNAADCLGRFVECQECHESTFPASWNRFGTSLIGALPDDSDFAQGLPIALAAVENMDADGDGVSNLTEILSGTYPGDRSSFWMKPPAQTAPENPRYRVDEYDFSFAFRRASILYCGRSPSYEELAVYRAPGADPSALRNQLHERVDQCLNGPYWLKEGLKRLGDERIRPVKSAGPESKIIVYQWRLVIGDYEYDYRLWNYVLSGGRDARDLLLAQYHIVDDSSGGVKRVEDPIPKPDEGAFAGGQPLQKEYRAGMLTTQWYLARNTMFSELPRTSAAAAYRAYLGMDIAKTQGIFPVPGEPDDIDKKGVKEARCASCHSTLDPLAYAFAKYNGISRSGNPLFLLFGIFDFPFGDYDDGRPVQLIPGWSDSEQQPVIMGQKVDSLRDWAEVAANSDEFARNVAQIFYVHALSRGPNAEEIDEFTALWRHLPEDKYSANRLIHRLIDTHAFGVP
ncbi:MAG TPA: hypothetical protein VFQ61_20855, partial [Polyangiaceae bacterium]|nr:hypothetical protein [Polyangiaceae bacterium]